MRRRKQTDEMKSAKVQLMRLDEYEFALSCNYSGNGFHTDFIRQEHKVVYLLTWPLLSASNWQSR